MEALELGQVLGGQLPEHFLIIESRIIATVLGDTGDVGSLQLLQHMVHIIGGHLRPVIADNGAEV